MTAYKFWLIFNLTSGSAPTTAHSTEKSAREEAERLARKHPGHRFVVLESMYEMTTEAAPVAKVVHKKLPK